MLMNESYSLRDISHDGPNTVDPKFCCLNILMEVHVTEFHVDEIVNGVKVTHVENCHEVFAIFAADLSDCAALVLDHVFGQGSERSGQFSCKGLSVIRITLKGIPGR